MNLRNLTKYLLTLASLSLILVGLFSQPTHAASIKKSDMKRVGHFKIDKRQPQGCALTEKYYVYTDSWSGGGKNGNTTIVFRKRSDGKKVSTTGDLKDEDFKHASSLYYEWGSNYLEIIDAQSGKWWCARVSGTPTLLDSTSKCGKRLGSSGLDKGNNSYYRQGWTKYGNTYLRAYSGDSNSNNRIEVYSNRKWKENFDFPLEKPQCELEDVAVDGNTGDVYAICWNHSSGSYVDYWRIKASVFKKYINASGGSSSSSSSSDIYSDKPYDPSADGLATRDETFKPEVTESTYDGTVDTTFFGTLQDDKEGCGVYTVLQFIIDLLTIGIGVAAVLGIVISGILYLTARGNVAQVTKAKRRIYEIFMGLVAYVALYAITSFLIPTFNPEFKTCRQASEQSSEQAAEQTTD